MTTAGSNGAADDAQYLGIFGSWEARVFRSDDGSQQCAARALHTGLIQGDILWVFNTASRVTAAEGFLAVDRRLAAEARSASVEFDDGRRFELDRGNDLHFYNASANGAEILDAMERLLAMVLVLDRGTPEPAMIPVSLIGFTRASSAARLACGF